MRKQWNIKSENEELKKQIKKISDDNNLNLNDLVISYLAGKNVCEYEDIKKYLYPDRNSFYDTSSLIDIENIIERILLAKEKNERVTIYGDYDVDGLTSSSILYDFLLEIGINTSIYIPNRLSEGYGLNIDAIDIIKKKRCDLIITVDCGITSVSEVEYAKEQGIDVIITDHHETQESIPKCIGVLDNKREESNYPFKELARCGVAFKLITALAKRLNLEDFRYLKYLDIVAIGTIADIVPLIDENRVIAKLGLQLLNQTKNLGLYKLFESLNYKKVDSTNISFGIAPRFNASGRMGDVDVTLDLLCCNDFEKAEQLVQKLNQYNEQRQEIEHDIFKQAIEIIEKDNLLKNKIILINGKNWHHGVIGIVASEIVEKYNKPVILVSNKDGKLHGSGRSIKDFSLFEALYENKNLLTSFGRHDMAIGLTFEEDKLEELQDKLNQTAIRMNIDQIVPKINIEKEIDIRKLTIEDVKQLELLEPFGQKNSKPLYVFRDLIIDSIRTLSNGKHLKIIARKNVAKIDIIGFNQGKLTEELKIGDRIDLVGALELNKLQIEPNMQIVIKDIRKSI